MAYCHDKGIEVGSLPGRAALGCDDLVHRSRDYVLRHLPRRTVRRERERPQCQLGTVVELALQAVHERSARGQVEQEQPADAACHHRSLARSVGENPHGHRVAIVNQSRVAAEPVPVPFGLERLGEIPKVPGDRASSSEGSLGRRLQERSGHLGTQLPVQVGDRLAAGEDLAALAKDRESRPEVLGDLCPVEVIRGNVDICDGAHLLGEHLKKRTVGGTGFGHEIPGMFGHWDQLPTEVLGERSQQRQDQFLAKARHLPFEALARQFR